MNSNLASSKALGFGVLAVALWMYYVAHSGLIAPMGVNPGIMHTVMTLAALGLLIAGIVAFLRHEGWLAFFFLLWSGLAWGVGGHHMYMVHHYMGSHMGDMGHGSMLFVAWFAVTITLVNLYLWFASLKGHKQLGGAVSITVLLIWVSWLLVALSCFLNIWILGRIGGIVGLASAVVAFYVSAGTLARESCPNMTLPCIPRNDPAGQGAGPGGSQSHTL